jgi:pyruvate,water dikinase
MAELRTFDEITPGDIDAVGGKGLSLGLMARAGLPVPPGFCLTSEAHRRLRGNSPRADDALAIDISQAYRRLGEGAVAVRSSATAEDGAETSFAGQQETILGVQGEGHVLDAIALCWASLDSDRAVAYRQKQGVEESGLAMAVVVQRLVPAEVAGVLFTIDPLDPEGKRMLVEASWGLGESVVSGKVTPDRYLLDRQSGKLLEQHLGQKTVMFTSDGQQNVPQDKQNVPCLDEMRLHELAELARKVEAFYGDARDVEWAWADGRFWLLQARPITTISAAEREKVRREEIAAAASKAARDGTVWARFNLAEILAEPTPMTWSVVSLFMSGQGGFGLTYRDLGYGPDPSLDEIGVYDLVCGRPYCNLSREPLLYNHGQPLEHQFDLLKATPSRALYPRARFNPRKAGFFYWMFGPIHAWRSFRFELSLQNWVRGFADRLRGEIIPAFDSEFTQGASEELSTLDDVGLLERLKHWAHRTLIDFARDSLKATVLAAVAMGKIEYLLIRSLGAERTRAALGELTMGVRPDPEADLPGALRDLAAGRLDRTTFLERFGHRGPNEMELASPRWSEEMAPPTGTPETQAEKADKERMEESSANAWLRIADEARLPALQRNLLEPELKSLHTYLALRETGKHYLMKGYSLLRRILLELDRRHRLNGGIFYLVPEEMPMLVNGEDVRPLIAARRRRRQIALSLEVPQVLFSDDLEAIGRPQPLLGADVMQGVPLSAGSAEARALVLDRPDGATIPSEPYILICPSTDPAWVPLFVHARGLVMETGGVLSHGAIVAREFGLPAVAGLSDIHKRLKTGQRLRVDGGTGTVAVLPD